MGSPAKQQITQAQPTTSHIYRLEDIPVDKVNQHEDGPLARKVKQEVDEYMKENDHIPYLLNDSQKLIKLKVQQLLEQKQDYTTADFSEIITQDLPNYNIQKIPVAEHKNLYKHIANHWQIPLDLETNKPAGFYPSIGGFHYNSSANGYIIERIHKDFAPFLITAPNLTRERMLESVNPQIYILEDLLLETFEQVKNTNENIHRAFSDSAVQQVQERNPDKTLGQLILEGTILKNVYQLDDPYGEIPTDKHYAATSNIRGKQKIDMGTPNGPFKTDTLYIGFNKDVI